MTLQTDSKDLKQTLLLMLSALVVMVVSFPLFQSFDAPQVQSRLELAQSALVLQAAELQGEPGAPQQELLNGLLRGQDAKQGALKQYQGAIAKAESTLLALEQLNNAESDAQSATGESATTLEQQRSELQQLRLEAGVLAASQQQFDLAQSLWQDSIPAEEEAMFSPDERQRSESEQFNSEQSNPVALDQLPAMLTGLWSDSPRLLPSLERSLRDGLTGWFRDETLERLFTLDQRQDELETLQAVRQETAASSLVRLGVVSFIPGVGIILGSLIWLLLAVVGWRRRGQENSPFNIQPWTVPWPGLTIWFGVSLGFFLIGQLAVSALAGGIIGGIVQAFEPALLLRAKAIGVFFSYGAMAIAVLTFLYVLLKRYLPLEKDWFRLSLKGGNWFAWGLGGYLMAYPPVLLISALNAQIWQGKGGSNPLLSLALENQDNVALLFFFVTAAIAAPFFEEIFFRGFLMTSLTRYLPSWGAVVVSGGIFALVHLSLSEVLPLMTLGIILGFVYGRSRNLLASILLHGLWNSGTLISLFLLGSALS